MALILERSMGMGFLDEDSDLVSGCRANGEYRCLIPQGPEQRQKRESFESWHPVQTTTVQTKVRRSRLSQPPNRYKTRGLQVWTYEANPSLSGMTTSAAPESKSHQSAIITDLSSV